MALSNIPRSEASVVDAGPESKWVHGRMDLPVDRQVRIFRLRYSCTRQDAPAHCASVASLGRNQPTSKSVDPITKCRPKQVSEFRSPLNTCSSTRICRLDSIQERNAGAIGGRSQKCQEEGKSSLDTRDTPFGTQHPTP